MLANPLLIPNLSDRRAVAKTHLSMKMQGLCPAVDTPVNIRKILLGDDPTLIDDTQAVFNELTARLGEAAVGSWLLSEHPYLERAHVTPLRRWWVLNNKLQEIRR